MIEFGESQPKTRKKRTCAAKPKTTKSDDGAPKKRRGPKIGKPAVGETLTGNIRVHENFRSMILGNQRNILVYLPPSYDEDSDRRYPVLYVNDGQNVFDAATAFGGVEWELDETLEALIAENLIQEIIVVAVYNTEDRSAEYTYCDDPEDEEGGGNGDAYLAFLINEVRPFINKRYRTSRKADETGILGSSLGGLMALYAGWMRPDVFSIVAAISPSLWWADCGLINLIANDDAMTGPSRIWLDMGTEESDEDEDEDEMYDNIEEVRMMGEVLLAKGYTLGENLFYYEAEGATHDEYSWGQRMDSILQALFPVEETEECEECEEEE